MTLKKSILSYYLYEQYDKGFFLKEVIIYLGKNVHNKSLKASELKNTCPKLGVNMFLMFPVYKYTHPIGLSNSLSWLWGISTFPCIYLKFIQKYVSSCSLGSTSCFSTSFLNPSILVFYAVKVSFYPSTIHPFGESEFPSVLIVCTSYSIESTLPLQV